MTQPGGKPCCTSLAATKEKVTTALLDLLLGAAEGIPCESRWTHLSPAFKKTLVRKVVHSEGLKNFGNFMGGSAAGDHAIDGDAAAAMGDFLQALNGVRLHRAVEYYKNESVYWELAVLTIVMKIADKLLYALMGGADRHAAPCTLSELVNQESSLIAVVMSELSALLDTWDGDALRRPWCILQLVGAPVQQIDFVRQSRSQVLLMISSLSRRCERKFAGWPYRLHVLVEPAASEELRTAVSEAAAAERQCCTDTFLLGIRRKFPSAELLRSERCRRVLQAVLKSVRLATDFSERQNASITSSQPRRSGARAFAHYSKEHLIQQACTVHRHYGGDGGRKLASLVDSMKPVKAKLMPLLTPLGANTLPEQPAIDVPLSIPLTAPLAEPAGANQEPQHEQVVALGAAGDHADADVGHGIISPFSFGRNEVMLEGVVAEVKATKAKATPRSRSPKSKLRRGLSPFMLYKNQLIKAAKANAAGRPLSPEELSDLKAHAKARWEAIGDKSAYDELYRNWQVGEATPKTVSQARDFLGIWGGGSASSPVSAVELWRHVKQHGMPSDDQVHGDTRCFIDADTTTVDWRTYSGFNLHGCLRGALGVCSRSIAACPAFSLIHDGLENYLDFLPRSLSCKGDILLVVEGKLKEPMGQIARRVFFITGTVWKPKVFDATLCDFVQDSDRTAPMLTLPCDVRIARRQSLVSAQYQCVATECSGALVMSLTSVFSSMILFEAVYDPVLLDNSMNFSRIRAVERQGILYEPGMGQPLKADAMAQRRRERRQASAAARVRRQDDPLAGLVRGRGRGRGRGRSHPGKQQRSAGVDRGRGEGSEHGGGVEDGARRGDVAGEELPPSDFALGSEAPCLVDAASASGPHDGAVDGMAADDMDIDVVQPGDFAADDDEDLDLEAELGLLIGEDLQELQATFGERGSAGDPLVSGDGPEDGVLGLNAELVADVLGGAAINAEALGLGVHDSCADGGGADEKDPSAEASPHEAGQEELEVPLVPPSVWERYRVQKPSGMGYVIRDGRSVMRIIRGKPKHALSVRCLLPAQRLHFFVATAL